MNATLAADDHCRLEKALLLAAWRGFASIYSQRSLDHSICHPRVQTLCIYACTEASSAFLLIILLLMILLVPIVFCVQSLVRLFILENIIAFAA